MTMSDDTRSKHSLFVVPYAGEYIIQANRENGFKTLLRCDFEENATSVMRVANALRGEFPKMTGQDAVFWASKIRLKAQGS